MMVSKTNSTSPIPEITTDRHSEGSFLSFGEGRCRRQMGEDSSGVSKSKYIRTFATTVFLLILTLTAHAQTEAKKPDTLDYSFLRFDDLHDYYTSKSINIIDAEDPNLYFEAYAWLGTTYHWGGRSKQGVDCSGFACSVYNRLYGTDLSGAAGDIFKKCDPILPSELKEGDFVFFNINGHYLYHVGIYLQNGKFAHAAVHGGVMISSLDEAYYKRWFYKGGRLRTVEVAADSTEGQ